MKSYHGEQCLKPDQVTKVIDPCLDVCMLIGHTICRLPNSACLAGPVKAADDFSETYLASAQYGFSVQIEKRKA